LSGTKIFFVKINLRWFKSYETCTKRFVLFVTFLFLFITGFANPVNDNCPSATVISIPNAGYGLGTFTSLQTDLTTATVQTGETFAPAIFVAGLDKKSVWYKFSIPTIRAVRVTLSQPGTTITAGDVGFAVYKATNCLPGNADISSKLTPIVTFGNTYHPCVPSGDYLIQVSSNLNANGPIIIQIEISDQTGAAYDHPNQAYAFGTVGYYASKIDFNTECQSIEDATESCNAFANASDYNKSAWITFKTPGYFDYIVVMLSGTGASTYFPSNNNAATYRNFGYRLYKGNAVTTPIASLVSVGGCDSLASNGYYAGYKMYKCSDLDTSTTYSIQIFIKKDFGDDIRLGILTGGTGPTKAPKPILSAVPSPNAIGILPASPVGTLTAVNDVWGCNSRHNTTSCTALPDTGIVYAGSQYNLSSFFTFTLQTTCAVYFNGYVTQCGPQPLIRVFKQGLTNNCNNLDTANIIGTFIQASTIDCLPPGNYTVQVTGQDATKWYGEFSYGTPQGNYEQCKSTNLGNSFLLNLTAYTRKAANKYSLNVTGAYDILNKVGSTMQPLANGISYSAISDTMGCKNTLRPADTTCNPSNYKVIYREFAVADSGVADFSNLSEPYSANWRYRLYSGDANALAAAQNVFAFPDKITGLVPKSDCFNGLVSCYNKTVCVVPGTYTLTTFGSDANVGTVDKPVITFIRTRTRHNSPFTAQNLGSIMDTLGAGGGTIKTDIDVWSCEDNAVAINGYQPCSVGGKPATKAIYRQFYLKEPALVQIQNTGYYYCYNMAYGTKTLFYGKATDGFAGLASVGGQWNCFSYSAGTTVGCDLLPAGWYTVVSYNQGPSYDSTFRSLNLESRYNSAVSYNDEYNIRITPTCPAPTHNRPYKASVNSSNQPHLIQLVNRVNSTAAYPRTDTTYILPTENFNCILDTPFAKHPIISCEATANRVAYYVFKTTQECFLQINTGGYYAVLYNKDVRTDSALFGTLTPIQTCNNSAGFIQFCYFQPGTYTLVIFAKDANICHGVTPSIYIDSTKKYSRFDYAKNAYDFGVVPPDSAWHFGKVGDVNPLNSSRKPSNDFFYCSTGASDTDPTGGSCGTAINPNIYNSGPNKPLYDSAFSASKGIAKRNLWYTFVANQPGYVKVKVEAKTTGRDYQPKFAVYQSNVDGSLPFSTVVSSGEVDSTTAQGLGFIATNIIQYYPGYCSQTANELSFYRDPCSAYTSRYYVLVENVNADAYEGGGTLPNTQIEVAVFIDSVTLVLPKHDHYYQAGNLGTLAAGTFQGDVDNYSCATKDATDPFYYYGGYSNCQKTLWYKFTPTITGNVRYHMKVNGLYKYDYYNIQLFRQTIPGDSTTNGLQIQGYTAVYDNSTNSYWGECCVSPGTYYIMLTGCDQLNESVYPEVQLIEAVGDFCSKAVPAVLNGPGAVSASVLVNCHTIGTDYGEFGPQLTCPAGANTADYKSSWFRMDIGGTDTLDVTTYLVENTNAASSDIKYRLMTGNCGAMQEQSCVLDALTQNTYQCLVPGQSYYVQVFTPISKFNQAVTGTIDLKLSAVAHADTCTALTNCLATANFTSVFNCNTDDSVKFVNFSTYGTSIAYKWSFGYNAQISTEVSPSFFYPPLSYDSTYTVKLIVQNISCGKKDSVTRTVTVPGRPFVNFGNDLSRCDGTAVTLHATSFSGASYLWQNGSTADTFRITVTGNNEYWVKINYNGCSSIDTVKVLVSSIKARPLQNIVLCTDSVSINAGRGLGETYKWNTGATSTAIFVSSPGFYWVDIKYFSCTYRDSFVVNNVATARPLGNDTTVCITAAGYKLRATTAGAVSYTWQNGTSADTFKVTTPGQYYVSINFGSCVVKDTVNIGGYPAPVLQGIDTSICFGSSIVLPWQKVVNASGIYRDTLRFATGCDSLIRRITVTALSKPAIGGDTTLCLAQDPFVLNATTPGAISYLWQNGASTATFNVTEPGLYWVNVNFGSCSSRDSIVISGTGAPITRTTDTSICFGLSYTLPWGMKVTAGGTYRDTIASYLGCDSIMQIVNLTIKTRPVLGNDTIVSICSGSSFNLSAIYTTSGLTSNWTFGGLQIANPTAANLSGIYRLVAANISGCSDTATLTLSISPKPILGNDTAVSICQGDTFNLTSAYSTTGLISNWTINSFAVNNPTSVNTNGSYQLIAVNNAGCADTAFITLASNLKPVLPKDSSIQICQGNTVNLNNIYNTTGFATNWTLNKTAVNNPATVSAIGIYRLIATNVPGCTDTAFVTLSNSPKPTLGNDTIVHICQGNSSNLTAIYNTGSNINRWTNAGIAVQNASSVNIAGNYRLISTTTFGCTDTVLLVLNIVPNPVVVTNNPSPVCAPKTIDLTDASVTSGSSAGLTFSYFTDAAAINNFPTPTNAISGIYFIKGSNNNGCFDIEPVTVTYYQKPIVSAGSDISICDKDSTILRATVTNSTAAVTYQWQPVVAGGIRQPNSSTTLVKPLSTQQYILTVNDTYGCNFNVKDSMLVTMQPPVNAFAGNDTIAATGIPHQLNASGGTNYLWAPSGLLNNPTISNPLAILSYDTHFVVTVKDAAGCTGYDTVFIKVYAGNTYYIPNAFSPNGDSKNDIFKPLGVGIVSTEYFRIFNRYGAIVFETSQSNKGWDGICKGVRQPIGNYIWMIKGKGSNGKMIEMKGNVLLLR
jgi:gliding motility-associated-like protein